MINPLILFDPSITSFQEKTNQSPQIPQGPHAIFWFPADVTVDLKSQDVSAQKEQKKKKTGWSGSFLTRRNPSLLISGSQGSLLFNCQSYLDSFTVFLTPFDLEKSHEKQLASVSLRVFDTSPRTQRVFQSFCRDLPSAVAGVSTGYARNLSIGGIGNKVSVDGQILTFTTGLSHASSVQLPLSIQVTCETPTQITLYGLNKKEVFQWASRLRYHLFQKNVYAKPLLQFEGEESVRKETRKK